MILIIKSFAPKQKFIQQSFETIEALQRSLIQLSFEIHKNISNKKENQKFIWSEIYIATSLTNLEEFYKSNQHINTAKKLNRNLKDPEMDVVIF